MSFRRSTVRGPLASIVVCAFLLHISAAQALPNDYVRLALAYGGDDRTDATLFFANIDGDQSMSGGPMLIEGHLVDHATGANHPYSIEVPFEALDSITLSEVPQLEDSEEQTYEIYQDGERMPVVLYLETSADPLKANSYIHTGTFYYEDSGKVVSFAAVNDPIPVVLVVGAAVLLICGVNIIDQLVESCAEEAKEACDPNGVKWCKAKITAWSLLSGCRSECTFACHEPVPQAKKTMAPRLIPLGN